MKPARTPMAAATLVSIVLAVPAAAQQQDPVYSFSLDYAPNGSIVFAQDSVNGNWSYSYDPFDRLNGASRPGRSVGYEYDRNGNRWRQNSFDGVSPSRPYTFNPATNRIVGMIYDALGNIVSDGSHSYTYDAENRLIKVDGGTTAEYAYDAMGRRVRKTASGSIAEFLYDPAGRQVAARDGTTGSLRSAEVYVGDRHLATYARGRTYFHHEDWLGSSRLTTLPDGAATEQCADLPFGDAVACAAGSGHEPSSTPFAGYERDAESQLDHTWFRQYSSAQGRWTTPDPYLGSLDPSDPQSLNRYTYVTNDPIGFRDPLGLYQGCVFANDTVSEEGSKITEEECKKQGGRWGEIHTVPGTTPRVNPIPIYFPPSFWYIPYLPTPGGGGPGGNSTAYDTPIGPRKPDIDDLCGPLPLPTIEQQMTLARNRVPTISAAHPRKHHQRSHWEIAYVTYNCTLGANSIAFQVGTWEACRAEAESGHMHGHVEEMPHVEWFEQPRVNPPPAWRPPPGCGRR